MYGVILAAIREKSYKSSSRVKITLFSIFHVSMRSKDE